MKLTLVQEILRWFLRARVAHVINLTNRSIEKDGKSVTKRRMKVELSLTWKAL